MGNGVAIKTPERSEFQLLTKAIAAGDAILWPASQAAVIRRRDGANFFSVAGAIRIAAVAFRRGKLLAGVAFPVGIFGIRHYNLLCS